MTETEWIAVIAIIPATVASVGAALASWKNHGKIAEVKVAVDGRMDEALARVQQLSKALQGAGLKLPDDPSIKGPAGHER